MSITTAYFPSENRKAVELGFFPRGGGSFASAAGGRYSEQKELSSGLNFGV